MSIGAARLRSRAGQLAAIGLTAAVLSGVAVGLAGALESGLDGAVRAATEDADARLFVTLASADEVADAIAPVFGGSSVEVAETPEGALVTPGRVGTGDLAALRDGARAVPDALVDAGVASRTAVTGNLAVWAGELLDLTWRARLLAVVPALLVAVGGLVAARDVVRVLALSRVRELAVIRARGASRGRLLLGEVREIAAVGALGAAVGAVVAALVAGAPTLLALLLIAVVTLALCVVAVPVVLRAVPRDRADEAATASGRGRAAGTLGIVLLAAATVLTLGRLLTSGSSADPVGVAAPALGVLAGAGLVVALVGAAARIVELAAPAWRGLGPALAVRRLARRLPMLATVVLLVAIASASTVFAAVFTATGQRVAEDVRVLRVGGDLLVKGWAAGSDVATIPAAGVSARLAAPGVLGDDEPLLLALTAEQLDATLHDVPGLVDVESLTAAMAGPSGGVALPDGATRLEFAVDATPGVTLRAWIRDAAGAVRSVPLDAPVEGSPRALIALDADVSRGGSLVSVRVPAVTVTTPDGEIVVELPSGWEPQVGVFPRLADRQFSVTEAGLGFDLEREARDDVLVRLMPAGARGEPVPVVVTRELAADNAVDVGDVIEVRFAGTGRLLIGEIAALVSAVPTAGDAAAVLADLPAFTMQQLRLTETVPSVDSLVVRSDDLSAVRAALPPGAAATGLEPGTADRMLGIATGLLWLAAAGGIALAIVGSAGVSSTLVAERRRETRILAVLGEPAPRQARGQRLELALTVALAAVGGAAVGALLAVVAVPPFARAATPGAGVLPVIELQVDVVTGGVLLGALLLALAVVIVVHGSRVVRDVHRADGVVS